MRHRLRAFGLEVDAGFQVPWLPTSRQTAPISLALDEEEPAAVDAGWPGEGWHSISEERAPDGELERGISQHEQHGYRLHALGFGLARIAGGGTRVVYARSPAADETASQRFLVGRVLPWAAAVQGYEVLHASAVAIDDRAVAFLGPSGAGKSSIAVELVARGARFLSDDALAVERDTGVLRVHPGPAVASVRAPTGGRVVVPLVPPHDPVPLGAVCILAGGGAGEIDVMQSVDPRLLLANTFVRGLQRADRLRTQLDVCGAIARETTLLRVRTDAETDLLAVAAAVRRHLQAPSPV